MQGKADMRLLHVLPWGQLSSGGPIEGVRQVCPFIFQLGHHVEVVVVESPDAVDVGDLGAPVHALGPAHLRHRYCPRLKPWLTEHRAEYDAIIVNGIWTYPGWAVHQVATKFNIPYFVFTHGMLDPWFNRAYPLKRIKKMLYWPWQHAVLRDAKAVLFTTEEERLLARQSFKPYNVTERVVPYGTAWPPAFEEGQQKAFYGQVPEAKQRRMLLFLGRIHPKKGVDVLIRAFAKVFGEKNEWVLVIAGPDPDGMVGKLKVLASGLGVADRVFWPGMLRGDAKWGAFRTADAFVLPSHQENFGISVAEAAGCGTPVLISNKVNIWREIEAMEAGIVAADTVEGTVESLLKFDRMSPAQLDTMGRQAVKCFGDHFESSKMARGMLDVVTELAVQQQEAVRTPVSA